VFTQEGRHHNQKSEKRVGISGISKNAPAFGSLLEKQFTLGSKGEERRTSGVQRPGGQGIRGRGKSVALSRVRPDRFE